jgi:hypothetical protein
MDTLITLIRLPVGLLAIPIVAVWWLLVWPFEFLLGAICLPLAAVFMKRDEIKKS